MIQFLDQKRGKNTGKTHVKLWEQQINLTFETAAVRLSAALSVPSVH